MPLTDQEGVRRLECVVRAAVSSPRGPRIKARAPESADQTSGTVQDATRPQEVAASWQNRGAAGAG